jgi:hypothetical protein
VAARPGFRAAVRGGPRSGGIGLDSPASPSPDPGGRQHSGAPQVAYDRVRHDQRIGVHNSWLSVWSPSLWLCDLKRCSMARGWGERIWLRFKPGERVRGLS